MDEIFRFRPEGLDPAGCPASNTVVKSISQKHRLACYVVTALALAIVWVGHAGEASPRAKPILLYSRYFNAVGESRYLPDGAYREVLTRLRTEFEVRNNQAAPDSKSLSGVSVILIANPSDKAVGTNPPPHHFSAADTVALEKFVRHGGGLIIMGNQENHNLEIEDTNKLLARFGLQFRNVYTDAKKLVLPKKAKLIGGLRWAYYTGNQVALDLKHTAKPRSLIQNDLSQKPIKGTRDEAGTLLATAEPRKGRVIVVTDAGWISNDALSEKGIGDVAIKGQDNWEILQRLVHWAAHSEKK